MSEKPVLLYVDDRPCTLSNNLFGRDDIDLILLRNTAYPMPEDYLERTSKYPCFYRDPSQFTLSECERFACWLKSQNIQEPTHLLNPSEPEQYFAQALGRHLELPSLSEQQVTWLRNKCAMKTKFRQLGFKTAKYAAISSIDEVLIFAENNGWPIVVKPQDGGACVDTYLLQDAPELSKVCLHAGSEWMVESYIDGQEWECCALIKDGKVLDTYISFMPARPIDIVEGAINANITIRPHPEGYFPIDSKEMVQRIVDGMELDHGYMHMEFFINSAGELVLGETALRLAGCEIPANHAYACGFNIYDALLDIHLGREPDMTYSVAQQCVGDLLLPAASGKILKMTDSDTLLSQPGVIDFKPKMSVGDHITHRRASHFCSGVVHVAGPSVDNVLEKMHSVLNLYEIEGDQDKVTPVNNTKSMEDLGGM